MAILGVLIRLFTLLMVILFLVNFSSKSVMAQTNTRKQLRSLWCPSKPRHRLSGCYSIGSPEHGLGPHPLEPLPRPPMSLPSPPPPPPRPSKVCTL
ncbi:hypothetical protein RND81_06G105300 [Saponaria officinalis]|uniref:Transmembrane protein n=1 Tax=Saponaria officinalis TaxID=3572 RepID=A0AAW1K9U0_SAPOF